MAEDPEKHVSTDGGDGGAPTHHHLHGHERHGHEGPGSVAAAAAVKDPVCGMDVDPAQTPHKAHYEGHEYFFCSAGCRAKFQKEPSRYTPSAPRPAPIKSSEPAGAPRARRGTVQVEEGDGSAHC